MTGRTDPIVPRRPAQAAGPALRLLRQMFGRGVGDAAPSMASRRGSPDIAATGQADAETLAARLPPLLADAERIAATVAGGVHGRLRAGSGDSFWQYRPLTPGESAARIDWRQSARGDRLFVRETEWEAAQTVCLWRDRSPSMGWRSSASLPSKRSRAELVLLALSIGLLRGGEHLFLLDDDGARTRYAARGATDRLALRLLHDPDGDGPSLPGQHDLPRHARLVLAGDFLSPITETRALLASLSAIPVSPVLVQVLDPAELALPYDGRTRFEGVEGETPLLVDQAGDLRAGYADAIAAHQADLTALCTAGGATLLRHRTDEPPETLLLALHEAIAPRKGAGRVPHR